MNVKNRTLFIADNLPIMRGMNSDSVDLIYLDPPFNSDANYAAPIGSEAAGAVFKDTWSLSDVDVTWLDLIETKHPKLNQVIHTAMSDSDKSYLIYMAVRLLEMHRLLKSTGSIYLHCDPTMSHYLKLVMDSIFGKPNFRNEITWKRQTGHSDSHGFGRVADIILFYGNPIRKDAIRVPLSKEQASAYRYKDNVGCYDTGDLTAKGLSGGGYPYEFHGHHGPWRYPEEKIRELEAHGRIHLPKKTDGVPRLKRYLHEHKGVIPTSIWTDISPALGQEKTGYPTQKPIELLERIIKASSDTDHVIFDPFCGCATTLVTADRLQRQWIGIDVSRKAAELVVERIKGDQGLFQDITNREDIPQRTDLGNLPPYNCVENKQSLYGTQGGHCNGCGTHFRINNLEVDHIIATSVGGTDHLDNLQLLCSHCNRIKGDRGQEYLINRLAEL